AADIEHATPSRTSDTMNRLRERPVSVALIVIECLDTGHLRPESRTLGSDLASEFFGVSSERRRRAEFGEGSQRRVERALAAVCDGERLVGDRIERLHPQPLQY